MLIQFYANHKPWKSEILIGMLLPMTHKKKKIKFQDLSERSSSKKNIQEMKRKKNGNKKWAFAMTTDI